MVLGRIFGWVFVAAALLAASAEIAVSVRAGEFTSLALGRFWRDLSRASLDQIHYTFESTMPLLWDPGMTTLLALPAWPALLGFAAVLLYLFRSHIPPQGRRT